MEYKILLVSIVLSFLSCKETHETPVKEVLGNKKIYQEKYRNQLHFSPETNWMNDPNGMVYFDGEYHLFYQYYPDSTVWGPMHWGHAVSKDMISWEHLPIALYPDSLGYIFSGSAVVDSMNTAGFGKDAIVAVFTHHNMEGEKSGKDNFQYQSIAYSTDRGRTFTKYKGNPVIKNPGIRDFRDPKVIWDEQNDQWIMVFAAYDKALFYTSKNLKDWQSTGSFGIEGDNRLWECPDLFPLVVQGSDEVKWVLITSIQKQGPNGGTATSYFVGDWDGSTFLGDSSKQQWLDYGTDNYAYVTWDNAPNEVGERYGIGWMSNWQYAQVVPTDSWRSAMTLPRTLKLVKENDGYILTNFPVKELGSYILEDTTIISHEVKYRRSSPFHLALRELDLNGNKLTIDLQNGLGESVRITIGGAQQSMTVDRSKSGDVQFWEGFGAIHTASLKDIEVDQVDLFVDHASLEIFVNEGRVAMTEILFPSQPYHSIMIKSSNKLNPIHCSINELKSIWQH